MIAGKARVILVFLLTVVLLPSCTQQNPSEDKRPAEVVTPNDIDPAAMLGAWKVVAPELNITVVIGASLRTELLCGDLHGTWTAHPDGPIVIGVQGRDSGCTDEDVAAPTAWLEAVTTARIRGSQLLLIGSDDEPVLTLERVATRTDDSGKRPWLRDTIDPLPADFQPADGTVVGIWHPTSTPGARSMPYLDLRADASWVGFDGCNETHGRWRLGPGGAMAAVGGIQTLIGCQNFPVASSMTSATWAGFDNGQLVMLAADGLELARYER